MIKLSTLFIIVGLLGFFGIGYMHEQTHVEIFNSYGIDSHIEYFSNFPHVVTVPDKPCPTDSCTLANNNSDSLMYPLIIIYIVAILGFHTLLGLIEMLIDIKMIKLNNGDKING